MDSQSSRLSTRARREPLPAGAAHAALHFDRSVATGEGVVLVPPFGWEDLSSYRARREWAQSLAAQGHPTIRLDLPGTGDSADASEAPLIASWRAAVVDAAVALRAATGGSRVAAVGLGLGGFVAFLAAAAGTVDDLAVWSTPTRGLAAVRALRAFAGMSDPGELDAADVRRIWVAGYSLPLAALTELAAIDLAIDASQLDRPGQRALVIGRDGADPDQALVSALTATGVTVTALTGSGYDAMVEHPQTSTAAKTVSAAVITGEALVAMVQGVGVLGVGWLSGAFGLLVLSTVRTRRFADQLFNFVFLPQFFLAGVFTRTQDFRRSLGAISRVVPMRYAVDLIRSVGYAGAERSAVVHDPFVVSASVVAGLFVLFVTAGTTMFVRNERNR